MCFVRKVMLCVASAAFFVLVSLGDGQNLKGYYDLSNETKNRICENAAQKNPNLVKQLQTRAEFCVKHIQSELAALAKRHSCLTGIEQAEVERPDPHEMEHVLCGLIFRKKTHTIRVPSGWTSEPDKDGCVLYVWVRNILANKPPLRSSNYSDAFLIHGIEIRADYFLLLSEENKDLDRTVRALIDQRIREMCDEMKKLQTAEDKSADKEQ